MLIKPFATDLTFLTVIRLMINNSIKVLIWFILELRISIKREFRFVYLMINVIIQKIFLRKY